jgi:VWFA-related protein
VIRARWMGSRTVVGLAAFLAATIDWSARPAAVGAGQAATAAAQPAPTFRTATTIIEVDAIVKDGKGVFVPDLTAADFQVLENGTPQRVEAFYQVRGREVVPAPGAPQPPPVSPIRPVEALPASAMPAPRTDRVFVLLFDTDNIQPGAFDRAKKAAEDFLATSFKEGDVGGVVANGTMLNGRLTPVRAELEAAVSGIKPSGEALAVTREMRREWPRFTDAFEAYMVDRNDREAISRVVERACSDDPGACAARNQTTPVDTIVLEKARRLLPALRAMGLRTINTVKALSNGLARLPGRKTIIFMSDGFFAEDSWANLRQVTDLASRGSVRIYTLDTRGLDRTGDILDKGLSGIANPAGDAASFDTASDGPNALAADTGGLVIRHENDFARALREFADDTSNYYVLGYRPTDATADGKFRRITVRVKRDGAKVRARQGYLATAERMAGTPLPLPPVTVGSPTPVPTTNAEAAPAPPPVAAPPPAASPPAPAAAAAAGPPPPAEPIAARGRPDVGVRVDELTSMTRLRPDSASQAADTLVRQARSGWDAYQKGDLRGARIALGAAAAQAAAPPWVHYAFGWTLFAASEFAAAGEAWEKVRGVAPEFEPVYFDLADAYLQQREFAKAVTVLRGAQGRWPKDVEVYNALGVIQLARGSVDEAVTTFEQAVAVAPKDASACYNLAKTYEVRFVRTERLAKVGPGAVNIAGARLDHDRAVEYYGRVVQLGGPMVDAAKEGLKRLGQ